eukprot:UN04218
MNILCVISARGGSGGLPGKNIRSLLGKPLIAWSIEQAIATDGIDKVIVSTDSDEIAKSAKESGAEVPFIRPNELSTAEAGKFGVWKHALRSCREYYQEDYDLYLDFRIARVRCEMAQNISACIF